MIKGFVYAFASGMLVLLMRSKAWIGPLAEFQAVAFLLGMMSFAEFADAFCRRDDRG